MPQYTYKGLTQEEKSARVKALVAGATPPEKRGQPSKYRIDKEDEEDVREAKRKLKAAWLKDREKEATSEVEKLDASRTLLDDAGKPIVFEKGKSVEVAAGTILAGKLDSLCGVGKPAGQRREWERTEKKG